MYLGKKWLARRGAWMSEAGTLSLPLQHLRQWGAFQVSVEWMRALGKLLQIKEYALLLEEISWGQKVAEGTGLRWMVKVLVFPLGVFHHCVFCFFSLACSGCYWSSEKQQSLKKKKFLGSSLDRIVTSLFILLMLKEMYQKHYHQGITDSVATGETEAAFLLISISWPPWNSERK